MCKFEVSSEYFNVRDTLECGQVFRFKKFNNGYLVYSKDKACYLEEKEDKVILSTQYPDYFYHYFDLDRDYEKIYKKAISEDSEFLVKAANFGKGIRILNQDTEEMFYSFIVSQNNNIPRIKGTIEKICKKCGEKNNQFEDGYSFPTSYQLSKLSIEELNLLGLGYRSEYIQLLAKKIVEGFDVLSIKNLSADNLYKQLVSIKGIGPKVANCILLFGYHRTDSFPIDTWMYKIYKEDYMGELEDIKKITDYYITKYGDLSGYFQQYLFYYKRSDGKKV